MPCPTSSDCPRVGLPEWKIPISPRVTWIDGQDRQLYYRLSPTDSVQTPTDRQDTDPYRQTRHVCSPCDIQRDK